LNVLDAYNCELLGVEVDFSLPVKRVVPVLTRLVECHSYPTQLRTDNGPEFVSAKLSEWCEQHASRELLDAHPFRSLAQLRQLVNEWQHDYNTQRPHQTLRFMTPIKFKQAA